MLAVLNGEAEAGTVLSLLLESEGRCCAHTINVCEVFYDLLKRGGEGAAREGLAHLADLGVTIRADFTPDFWQDAARLKSQFRASLADCFGLILAQRLGADFLTKDRHELEAVQKSGAVSVVLLQ